MLSRIQLSFKFDKNIQDGMTDRVLLMNNVILYIVYTHL